MGPIRRLLDAHRSYHLREPQMLWYVGLLGTVCFPPFYLLRYLKAVDVYDDLALRLAAAAVCLLLLLRKHWPKKLEPYFFDYSYGVLIFTLPFTFVYTSLMNGGGTVGVGNTLMATFFLILVTTAANALVMLVIGVALAIAAYVINEPNPTVPVEYVARLPILLLVLAGGLLFKRALERATAEKVRTAYAWLAASIAHEMRNPLTQLKHSLEGVQQVLPPPGSFHALSSIGQAELDVLYRHVAHGELAIRRGLQAISMTLDEVHAKPPDSTSFQFLSAAEAVHKAVDEFSLGNDEAHDRVRVHVLDDFHFRGDETAFLYVLFNLMKNALYYVARHPDTHVDITVGGHEVKVRDTGPGIAPHVLQTLFEPFRSVGKAGGTGLGLAYCKRIMTAFGGSIHCASELGHFTEFTLHFPPISESARDTHSQQVLDAARAALAGKRLLLVEDDAAQRVTTRHKLRPLDLVIDDATDGQRALELLARHPYDLVLLDLHMPVLDGYQVVQRVRQGQAPANRYVRILAHTSEPPHVARVKTQRAGMDGFISKPSAQLPLVQALQRALQRPPARAASRPLEGRRLLLADDSAYNRRAVAAYLREAGAEVAEVDHGVAVLERLEGEGGYDAVLMDLNMPGLDGLETARAIRGSSAAWARLPIVALTAHSDAPAIDAARAAGMDGFLVKPVDAPVLYDTLLHLLTGPRESAGQVTPALPPTPPQESASPLLNEARLDSYRRLGLLDELLADYLPEIERLLDVLGIALQEQALDRAREALHSLLGMSGEAGALALYQRVRSVYVPVMEQRRWPDGNVWLADLRVLAAHTADALRAYSAQPDPAAVPDGE